MKNTCKGCITRRSPTCHAECKDYRMWKEEHEKELEEKRRYMEGRKIDAEVRTRKKQYIEGTYGKEYGFSRKRKREK